MTDAKFKLEDILNKKKAPPQILDLANIKIESEEDFRAVIEKIPDYRIQPERVCVFIGSWVTHFLNVVFATQPFQGKASKKVLKMHFC